MTRSLLWSAVLIIFVLVFSSSSIQAAFFPLDSFDTDQLPLLTLIVPGDLNQTAASTVSGPGILGGERDIWITMTQGTTPGTSMQAGVAGSVFQLACAPGVAGVAEIQWDGPDGNATSLDPTGLGGVDLTNGGPQDAFQLSVISDDWPVSPVLTIYTDATNFSTYTLNLPGLITAPGQSFIIPFTDFTVASGTGADFTNVGAVTLSIPPVDDLDLRLDFLGTISFADIEKSDALVVDVDGDGLVDPGDTLEYTIVVSNPADFPRDTTNVVFRDTPDPNTTLVVGSVTTTQGTVVRGNNPGDTSIEVNIGVIPDGASVTIRYRVTVNESISDDVVIRNLGTISGDDFDDKEDTTDTPVVGPPDDENEGEEEEEEEQPSAPPPDDTGDGTRPQPTSTPPTAFPTELPETGQLSVNRWPLVVAGLLIIIGVGALLKIRN